MKSWTRAQLDILPRQAKQIILIAFDSFALVFSVWAAYSLRLGVWYNPSIVHIGLMVAAPLVAIPVFVQFGLYRAVIRYLPERAFGSIARAVVLATLLWVFVVFAAEITRVVVVPRSIPLIYALLAILTVGGSRFLVKSVLWTPIRKKFGMSVAIYGAGASGLQLSEAIMRDGNRFVSAFLDAKKAMQGRDIAGVRVFRPDQLPHLIENMGVEEVIISMPELETSRRQEIVAELTSYPVKIRVLPAIADLASGRYLVSQLREIQIGDVLGRSAVPPQPELINSMIKGKTILVSGAGGSIGAQLCKLIIRSDPVKLVLFEANEFALYSIEQQLSKRTDIEIVPVLGSVCDKALVRRTLTSQSVEVLFHAAAHKHVPLVEANVLEGIRNNVVGTHTVALAALESGIQEFVLISTDKSVRPTNVMGATKRWAEFIVHNCAEKARKADTSQRFCAVRFGNVLGSNGSVVPLFKQQISDGGPVTVTDLTMTRYFMSIHEASELIIQAGALSNGGDLFILDMGEPVAIEQLARNMVELVGLSVRDDTNPTGDIEISEIGRRPGEKTHEELFYEPGNVQPTEHPKIMRAKDDETTLFNIEDKLSELTLALDQQNEELARSILFSVIER